jgi:hypothetical protein
MQKMGFSHEISWIPSSQGELGDSFFDEHMEWIKVRRCIAARGRFCIPNSARGFKSHKSDEHKGDEPKKNIIQREVFFHSSSLGKDY